MTFSISNISDKKIASMIDCGVWHSDCPVHINDLKLVVVDHIDFNGDINQGELVVHTVMADNVIAIFKELYEQSFPIEQIRTIENFNGDDDESMKANNSSCFNYRRIKGSNLFSVHSYGLAIDINPVQNPCISYLNDSNELIDPDLDQDYHVSFAKKLIDPQAGKDYLDRSDIRPGMVEPIVDIFKRRGFEIWGGEWNNPLDYHHFQVPRSKIKQLLNLK